MEETGYYLLNENLLSIKSSGRRRSKNDEIHIPEGKKNIFTDHADPKGVFPDLAGTRRVPRDVQVML